MSEQTTSKKNTHREIKIIIEVNDAAEQFYPESVKLGMHAAKVITKKHRSQLTGLENVADSALRLLMFSIILNDKRHATIYGVNHIRIIMTRLSVLACSHS